MPELAPVADRGPNPRGDSCEMISCVCPKQIPRKQLHYQQHPIALNQRQSAGGANSQRRATVMANHCLRRVKTTPAGDPASQTQLSIVSVGEKLFVKPANVF